MDTDMFDTSSCDSNTTLLASCVKRRSQFRIQGMAQFTQAQNACRNRPSHASFRVPRSANSLSGGSSMQNQPSNEKFHLKIADYELIVQYLENPENKAQVLNEGHKTKVGGRPLSRAVVFKQMLVALQSRGFPMQITGANLKKRWERYYAKYKEARNLKCQSGGGLTEEEFNLGYTLGDKLNKLCPHFDRMHVLLGGRPNVAPPSTRDWGMPDGDEVLTLPTDDEDEPDWMRDTEAAPASPTVILTEEPASVVDCMSSGYSEQRFDEEILEAAREEVLRAQNLPPGEGNEVHPSGGTPLDNRAPLDNHMENRPTVETRPVGENRPAGETRTPTRSESRANKENVNPKRNIRKVDDKAPVPKTNVVQIYTERLLQKADYKKDLIQNRDKWKMAELEEKK